jgi:hypothetical protein
MSDSLAGRTLCAPYKFVYKRNEDIPNCTISVKAVFGQVIDLPCNDNCEMFGIEWLSIERQGGKENIPNELRLHLKTRFKADKYGQYIRDLVDFTEEESEGGGNNMFRLRPQSPSSGSSYCCSSDSSSGSEVLEDPWPEDFEDEPHMTYQERLYVATRINRFLHEEPTKQERLWFATGNIKALQEQEQKKHSPVAKRLKLESPSQQKEDGTG